MKPSIFALLIFATACRRDHVRWEGTQAALGDTLGQIALREASVEFVKPEVQVAPVDSMACPASVASTTDGSTLYAAWLRRRPDSSVAVVASRSDDGGKQWTRPAMVDSVDVGLVGCARPGPSIAAAEGYVHVAYSLKAPEGFGVFFAHSMDRGATFQSPVIVVYGDRLSATATAAHGMRVAVAYEDPSGSGRRVDVALSRTQGHTFEPRERASPDEMPATRPRIAIRDTVVALSFAGIDSMARAVRIGRLSK
ncbi:MAG TPA: sialidase family protein [Gemmatimonadaceae bacterium]|nr:sialidase family protein [Gemmatimonadaceae bacterium]